MQIASLSQQHENTRRSGDTVPHILNLVTDEADLSASDFVWFTTVSTGVQLKSEAKWDPLSEEQVPVSAGDSASVVA